MFKRQTYKDLNIEQIGSVEFDLFQLKFDGIWVRIVTKDGTTSWFSRTGKLKQTIPTSLPDCVLIGEYMYGSQWSQKPERKGKTFIFDIESFWETDACGYTYEGRRQLLLSLFCDWHDALKNGFVLANHGEKQLAKEFFKGIVAGRYDYEGIVLRKWGDLTSDPLYRIKREVVDDFVVLEAYEGKGRLRGKLGGLVLGQYTNGRIVEVCSVGGGFSDELRSHIWLSWPEWRGTVVTCTGKARFASGALRHPNFLARRDDKLSTECIKPTA